MYENVLGEKKIMQTPGFDVGAELPARRCLRWSIYGSGTKHGGSTSDSGCHAPAGIDRQPPEGAIIVTLGFPMFRTSDGTAVT